jgi:hypothetical protein
MNETDTWTHTKGQIADKFRNQEIMELEFQGQNLFKTQNSRQIFASSTHSVHSIANSTMRSANSTLVRSLTRDVPLPSLSLSLSLTRARARDQRSGWWRGNGIILQLKIDDFFDHPQARNVFLQSWNHVPDRCCDNGFVAALLLFFAIQIRSGEFWAKEEK